MMESEAFHYLDHPAVRLTSADVPCPYAKNLEDAFRPQIHNIVNAVLKCLHRKK